MFKMHGINIDENPAEAAVSSTIGGVTCDICQKELCSKYFLKVHRQNTHGIMDDSNINGRDVNGTGGCGSRARRAALLDSSTTDHHSFALARLSNYENSKLSVDNHRNINRNFSFAGYAAAAAAAASNVHLSRSSAPRDASSVSSGATAVANSSNVSSISSGASVTGTGSRHSMAPSIGASAAAAAGGSGADKSTGPFHLPSGGNSNSGKFQVNASPLNESKDTRSSLSSSSSNQHFQHYTEVCALCDRRFKSIKWLKTHMANDHADVLPAFLAKLNSTNGFHHLFNSFYSVPKVSTSNLNVKNSPDGDTLRGKSQYGNDLPVNRKRSPATLLPPSPMSSQCKKVKSNELNCSSSGLLYDHELPLSLIQQFTKGAHEAFSANSARLASPSLHQHNNNNLFDVSFVSNVNNNSGVKENKKTGKMKESTQSLDNRHESSFQRDDERDDDVRDDDSHSSGGSSHESHKSSVKSHDSAENYPTTGNLRHFHRKLGTHKNNHQQDDDEDDFDDEDDARMQEHILNVKRERDSDASIDVQGKRKHKRRDEVFMDTAVKQSTIPRETDALKSGKDDISSRDTLPYAYGIPRDSFSSSGNKFIIQPFLLSAPVSTVLSVLFPSVTLFTFFSSLLQVTKVKTGSDSVTIARARNGEHDDPMEEKEEKVDDSFVPSLVYLPVVKKIDEPVTVAFHLTPA